MFVISTTLVPSSGPLSVPATVEPYAIIRRLDLESTGQTAGETRAPSWSTLVVPTITSDREEQLPMPDIIVPNFGEVLAEHLPGVEADAFPFLLSQLERTAADRYRAVGGGGR